MNVIELVRQKGIEPRRASGNKGGEYHSMCPTCGDGGKGQDSNRFHVWPEQNDGAGSWWCRQCDAGGDNIELLMRMDGLNFKEACAALGKDLPDMPPIPVKPRQALRRHKRQYQPSNYQKPVDQWRQHAEKLVTWAHDQLTENHPEQMEKLYKRGLDPDTVLRWRLGWNPGHTTKAGKVTDLFRAREAWGLNTIWKNKKSGQKKKLWIPRGLVIPYHRDGVLQRIRIRRPKAHLRSEDDPRYYAIPGSSAMPVLIGENRRAYSVIETELDGYLVDQAAGDLTGVLSLGSSSNMPDDYCHPHLDQALIILNALDYDQAGGKARAKWKAAYRQTKRWPVNKGKDPGEAYQAGVDIRQWILAGLPPAWHIGPSRFLAQTGKGADQPPDPDPQNATTTPDEPPQPEHPATVVELCELLQRHPVVIINTAEHRTVQDPPNWKNAEAAGRISHLVYNDPECIAHLDRHPGERIDGRNIHHA